MLTACSLPPSFDLSREAAEAAVALQRYTCLAATADKAGGAALPYVALRRTTLAVLHVLHEEASTAGQQQQHASKGGVSSEANSSGTEGTDCHRVIAEVAPTMLLAFAGMLNCSRASRAAVELLHISKVRMRGACVNDPNIFACYCVSIPVRLCSSSSAT